MLIKMINGKSRFLIYPSLRIRSDFYPSVTRCREYESEITLHEIVEEMAIVHAYAWRLAFAFAVAFSGRRQAWTQRRVTQKEETYAHILTYPKTDENRSRFYSNEHAEHLIRNQASISIVFARQRYRTTKETGKERMTEAHPTNM